VSNDRLYPRAAEGFAEALVITARLGAKKHVASTALGLAAALVAQDEDERGVQLVAAALSIREELGVGFDDELDDAIYDRAVGDAKATLGDEAFAAAWKRGRSMTAEDLVAFVQSR
jgi:hypothetical protein